MIFESDVFQRQLVFRLKDLSITNQNKIILGIFFFQLAVSILFPEIR